MKWPSLRRVRRFTPGTRGITMKCQCGDPLFYVEVGDLEFVECLTCERRYSMETS